MNGNIVNISCIVTSYNSKSTILDTLESLKKQTYPYWECIIVEDCSTDNSPQIIEAFIADDPKFRLYKNAENKKQAYSLNFAINKAIGEYIIILDSDDFVTDDCFQNRMEIIKSNPGYDFWQFPNLYEFTARNSEIIVLKEITSFAYKTKDNILSEYLRHKLPLRWNNSSAIWKKTKLEEIGMYNDKLPRLVDADLYTRALLYNLNYLENFAHTDFYYRITESEAEVSRKRARFVDGSLLYIDSILKLTEEKFEKQLPFVKKNLRKLFLHVYLITLLSVKFPKEKNEQIVNFGLEKEFIGSKQAGIMLWLKKMNHSGILSTRIIRGIIWKFSHNFYIHN